MPKYLVSENCCQINREAAIRKGIEPKAGLTIFSCLDGCLVVLDGQEGLLTEEEQALLVDELPEEFISD